MPILSVEVWQTTGDIDFEDLKMGQTSKFKWMQINHVLD